MAVNLFACHYVPYKNMQILNKAVLKEMLCEPAKFDSGLSSHLHLFFNSPSPGAQRSVLFFRCCPFENRKAISIHAVNMDKTSPSSLLYLIYVGAISDFFVCHSLLPTYSHDSSVAPS